MADTCGTLGGYRRHRRDGEDACPPCLSAIRVYQGRIRDALWQLAAEHPARFRQLYDTTDPGSDHRKRNAELALARALPAEYSAIRAAQKAGTR